MLSLSLLSKNLVHKITPNSLTDLVKGILCSAPKHQLSVIYKCKHLNISLEGKSLMQ